jgi:hypothetical protein
MDRKKDVKDTWVDALGLLGYLFQPLHFITDSRLKIVPSLD